MGISVKSIMKPKDVHLVTSAPAQTMKAFTFKGKDLWTIPALAEGQHANWRATNGDTPPGLYRVGYVYHQRPGIESDELCEAYGPLCFDLIDLENQETGNGRSGISIHGGRPWSRDRQPLKKTNGCVRCHNQDLLEKLFPLYERTIRLGGVLYHTVVR